MKTAIRFVVVPVTAIILAGCGSTFATRRVEQVKPAFIINVGEPVAIMPFETENALSNLGGQLSDEVIVNLLEHAPTMKIIPATVVRNYLLTNALGVGGIPDMHTIHNLKQGLKCRYLLTGNLFTSIGEIRYTDSYSNRVASGSVTVRLVDCDSLNVVWAKHVESTYLTSSYYIKGSERETTYYTDGQLMQGLLQQLGSDVAAHFYEHE